MSSASRMTGIGATVIVALLVLVAATGCGSDDGGTASTAAAETSGASGTGAAGLEQAQATLCAKLSDV